jgi:hypothetical protein
MKKLTLSLLVVFRMSAALPAGLQFDVRTTGSDTNNSGAFNPSGSSCGTDYSQQNSPQISYTDLVVGATTTTYTSVLNAVTSAVVCNTINVVSGSGCTTGLFYISSETAGSPNFATVDRSLGTAASVCTAYLGGSKATFCSNYSSGNCTAGAMASAITGNTIWQKSGTYTQTFAHANNNAASNAANVIINGYNTTHGDISPSCIAASTCARPIWAASFGSANMFNVQGNGISFIAVQFTATCSSSCFAGIDGDSAGVSVDLCKFDWSTATGGVALYSAASGVNGMEFIVTRSEFSGNSTAVFIEDNAGQPQAQIFINSSYCHNAQYCLYDNNSGNVVHWTVVQSAFGNNSRDIYEQAAGGGSIQLNADSFQNSTNEHVKANTNLNWMEVWNSIFYGGTYGISITSCLFCASSSNAYGNLSTANYTGWIASPNSTDVALTANPFTSSSNFVLNSTSGGGALLKAAGFPGVTPFGTGFASVGALQPSSGSTAIPYGFVY